MKEFLTVQIDQEQLIKVLQIAEERNSSISNLVRSFFQWIIKNETSLDYNSFYKRQPEQSLDEYLNEIEKKEILKACENATSKQKVANILGITLRSCRYRIDRHNIVFKST